MFAVTYNVSVRLWIILASEGFQLVQFRIVSRIPTGSASYCSKDSRWFSFALFQGFHLVQFCIVSGIPVGSVSHCFKDSSWFSFALFQGF